MKKNISMVLATLCAMPMMAQETYESAQTNTEDLNGAARYVGMGGAMEALGADISTISSNPAGIGLFRRSSASISFGLTALPGSDSYAKDLKISKEGKTVMNFDQVGFVFSMPTGNDNFVNFGFNYHKSRNFNDILTAANILSSSSQNKGAYLKALRGSSDKGGYCIGKNKSGEYKGYDDAKKDYTSRNYSQTDYLLWNAFLVDPKDGNYYYSDADSYVYGTEGAGYIGEYDFNISGNQNDRVFWGFTIGLKDVNYRRYTDYCEALVNEDGKYMGTVGMYDEREVTGAGFNVSAGVIIRPVAESPFRFGLSVTSPTWYELRSSNYTELSNRTNAGQYDHGKTNETYKYKVFTPWKFGASLGHTFGQDLAIGLSYEYTDYSSIDNRNITDEYYDYWDDAYHSSSESDRYMNPNTRKSLKGVSTIKFGFESKLTPDFAVRAGYNYVSPAYNKNAVRSTCLNADGCYYASTTDYTNWQATHRVTCGLGYAYRNFNIDLAYQYSSQKGEFYPFENIEGKNAATATDITNEKHQLIMTLGWKF